MDESEKALKRVKSDARSVLLSAPRGVLKRNFRREFMSLVGQDLPLYRLGFSSLDDFIRRSPDVVSESIGPTGEPTLYVVANEQTQHVASLVSRQKKPRLKVLSRATPMKRYNGPTRHQRYNRRSAPRPIPSRNRSLVGNKIFGSSVSGMTKHYHSSFVPAGAESNDWHLESHGYSKNLEPVSYSGPSNNLVNNNTTYTVTTPNTGIPPWDKYYSTATEFSSVFELFSTKDQYKDKLICVTGYPGGHEGIKQYDGEFRTLLFNTYQRKTLQQPCLNVFFGEDCWDITKYCDPFSLSSFGGDKIKVWGRLKYRFWQQKGEFCHSLKAHYYQRNDAISSTTNMSSVINKVQDLRITVNARLSVTKQQDISPPSFTQRIVSRKSSSTSSNTSSPDTSIVRSRAPVTSGSIEEWVRQEMDNKPNGLWGKILVAQYKKEFHKEPPGNLLETICNMPFIKREETCVKDNPILYYTVDKTPPTPILLDKTPPIPNCVELTVSDEDWIDVIVVSAIKPQHFYVQSLTDNCSIALRKMAEEMGRYFNKPPPSIAPVGSILQSSINRDILYAVYWVDSDEWCRTIVISGPDNLSYVYVRYPDYGNEDMIPVSTLYKLPDQFYSLPLQAISCSLIDFTDTSDKAAEIFDELVFEKSCSMLVTKKSHDMYIVDLAPPECGELSVIDLIDQKVNPVHTIIPCLPKFDSGCVPVRLVEVCPKEPGYIFVQIIGQGTRKLDQLLNNINEYYEPGGSIRDRLTKNRLELGMICCAQYDGYWHRVKVKEITPENSKVLIEYIDYGTEEVHEPSRLRKDRIHDPLSKLPPQAIKCKLYGVPADTSASDNNDIIMEKLSEYVDLELNLKMATETECIISDQSDQNINELLQQKPQMNLNTDSNNTTLQSPSLSLSPSPLSSSSSWQHASPLSWQQASSLSCQQTSSDPPVSPTVLDNNISRINENREYCNRVEEELIIQGVPSDDGIFSVLVSHCVSPLNFTVQLLSQYDDLVKLQERLQLYCTEGCPPALTEYQKGMVGVGRFHGDRSWYRVMLKNTFRYGMRNGKMVKEIPVQFVDYGNEEFVTDIVKITKELLHCLPFQGIPGQLSGHLPTCTDKQFEKLLVKKQFHCHIKGYDETTNRYYLSLLGYDTRKLVNDLI